MRSLIVPRHSHVLVPVLVLMLACSSDTQSPGEKAPAAEVSTKSSALVAPSFADLHTHMFAEESFSGGWFHGTVAGPLTTCDGGSPPSDHARVRQDLGSLLELCPNYDDIDLSSNLLLAAFFGIGGAVGSEFIGKIEGTEGDTGLHMGRRVPVTEWPRWDTIAHQQVFQDWLYQAHQGGLSLITVSLMGNEFLCSVLPYDNIKRPCSDMGDVDAQVQLMLDFDARTDWAEIALSPAHARQIIAQGKLAMVMSIEASKLFGTENWQTALDRYYALGVRALQPIHQLDNRFGGAAPHNAIFHAAQFIENCHVDYDCGITTGDFTLGFDVYLDEHGNCRNTKGLTAEGRALLQGMMDKGMLVDLAHVSEKGIEDAFEVAQANDYYPLYVSHGHFREVMNAKLADDEKTTPASVIRIIRQTGGMFGMRTLHDETRAYAPSGVANSCQGSTRSFAQALAFAQQGLKVPVAFGADFNGFIQQARPRFGDLGACSSGFKAEADAQQRLQVVSGPPRLGTDFDEYGLAHIGLLPDMLRDLEHLGADVDALAHSTETFLRMWERAEGPRAGMVDPADDIDLSGLEPYVDPDVREATYPTQCGYAYAPDSKVIEQKCRFDAECISGQCTSVLCSTFDGRCVCNEDGDCAASEFCEKENPTSGDNDCMPKRAEWDSCTRDGQCQSGKCGGCADAAGWCVIPNSKVYGDECHADSECTTGRCGADCYLNSLGHCLCQEDSDCGALQYCGYALNSGTCNNKKARGKSCLYDRECLSNNCRWTLTCG